MNFMARPRNLWRSAESLKEISSQAKLNPNALSFHMWKWVQSKKQFLWKNFVKACTFGSGCTVTWRIEGRSTSWSWPFHLTLKPDYQAEIHRSVGGKFKSSSTFKELSGNLENVRQVRRKRAQKFNDGHALWWRSVSKRPSYFVGWHGRPSWSQSDRTLTERTYQAVFSYARWWSSRRPLLAALEVHVILRAAKHWRVNVRAGHGRPCKESPWR